MAKFDQFAALATVCDSCLPPLVERQMRAGSITSFSYERQR